MVGSQKLNTEINENNNFYIKKKDLKDNSFSNLSYEQKDDNIANINPTQDAEYKERIGILENIVNEAPKLVLEVRI